MHWPQCQASCEVGLPCKKFLVLYIVFVCRVLGPSQPCWAACAHSKAKHCTQPSKQGAAHMQACKQARRCTHAIKQASKVLHTCNRASKRGAAHMQSSNQARRCTHASKQARRCSHKHATVHATGICMLCGLDTEDATGAAVLCARIVAVQLKMLSWYAEPVVTLSVDVEPVGCTIKLLSCEVRHIAAFSTTATQLSAAGSILCSILCTSLP